MRLRKKSKKPREEKRKIRREPKEKLRNSPKNKERKPRLLRSRERLTRKLPQRRPRLKHLRRLSKPPKMLSMLNN